MDKLIPVLVSKRNSSYTAHVISSPQIQSSNYSEWKALHAIQESFDKIVVDLICMDENTTDELNQMFYAPVCHVDCFRVQTAIHSRSCDIWLPIVYWSEGDSRYLSCPILEQFLYMYKDEDLSAETVDYYFQCWLRKESASVPKEEFSQKLEFLTKQFSEKHNYYIRLVDVPFHDKLYYRWSRSRLPRRKVSATEELESIAESIVYHPSSYDELVHSSDYKFVRIPANDKLNDFYNRIYRALMDERHRKGVLIVGQELTGRSFAIETVLRTIQRDVNYRPNSNKIWVRRNDNNYVSKVWKLSGSGIISGMASVGQWEARAEAIFSYAANNDLILYFESLLDLTEEGTTDLGSFSVADALMNYLKEKNIRIVSRITPTQLVKLRDRNRSFVNQFEILTMPAFSSEELLRLYISKIQNWKNAADSSERSPFEHISYMNQLVEWTNPNGGAPGSVCKWLDKISNRPSCSVQDDLLSQIGANFPLLKNELSPNCEEIKKELTDQVIGQEEAVDALTNWTLKFQALLSDPGRPAATMLFLGPTGVGKTESAKAVARFLYNDDSHFLRFDCNELNSPYAVLHLVGSARFDGTLTNAVRMEPFSVVLFDEIEKAHPAFHDLLLQILGEGRLTDGKGRTVSFKNCFIILTSNLGAGQTGRFAGFGDVSQNDRDVYFKALERFFRPEFINRLDKVVPFNRLGNSELELIARRFIDQISSREGFQKRKALLSISPTALDWLVQQGHDPKYGARQTQRSLERILVEPLSAFFSQSTWNTISVIEIDCENDKLTYSVSPIYESSRRKGMHLTSEMFDKTTAKEYNVFYSALLDWMNKIKGLFLSPDSSDKNLLDWEHLDEQTRLRFQIQEELDSLKNDLELVATISRSSQRGIDKKLNRHISDWDNRVQKISVPKPLSLEEWNLLLQSESGVYPQNIKLNQVEPDKDDALLEALARCSKIHQLMESGIPQPEEALILLFSTGEFTDKARLDAPINKLIQQYADDNCSPIRLQQHAYNPSQRRETLYYHAQGLGAYKRLSQGLSGVYVMFDSVGRLSRADSLIVLPYDSKQQTTDECIKTFLESKPKIWNELRYMYINDSFYESLDARKYFVLPLELAQALSQIIH